MGRGANSALTLLRGVREFLPNYKVACVKPSKDLGQNVVAFRVDMRMNKPEISSYLEKIYDLPVQKVQTQVVLGKTKRRGRYRFKRPDYKLAYVTLDAPFEFPEIFPEKQKKEE